MVEPCTRKQEVLSFIRQGLTDISVSRHKDRTGGWGLPLPNSKDQVIYVWIEALINYITGQGLGSGNHWQNVWSQNVKKIHCIGKNVWKFHAIYWPALLLSAKLPLPNTIYVHGFLTEGGEKISKSLGSRVDLLGLIDKYGADSLRFYLLQAFSPYDDGDFLEKNLLKSHNTFLANGIGNLYSRLWTLRSKADIKEPPTKPLTLDELSKPFQFNSHISSIWKEVDQLNSDINNAKPWETLKSKNPEKVKTDLTKWSNQFIKLIIQLEPFLPVACRVVSDNLQKTNVGHLFSRL